MRRTRWGEHRWSLGVGIVAILTTALPLLTAQISRAETVNQNAELVPVTPVTRRVAAASISIPPLPSLGQPDRFLPAPDPFADIYLVIKLGDRRVYVYDDHQVKTSFPIAIGRAGWETPTGQFKVLQMLRNPIWQNPFTGELIEPGADNPLGVRWIGFWTDGKNYIGFHGTPNTDSVGRPASHGCIRMYNQDVTQLFEMVKVGTPVIVTP